jgi:hypothetical protein
MPYDPGLDYSGPIVLERSKILSFITFEVISYPSTVDRWVKASKLLPCCSDVDPCAIKLRLAWRQHGQDVGVVGQARDGEIKARCPDEEFLELMG